MKRATDSKQESISKFELETGLVFSKKSLIREAFTHRSYLNENKEKHPSSNERLEFLGDAVLQFLASKYFFNKYPNKPEGILTSYRAAIVNTKSLSQEALRLRLGRFLFMSKGEEATGGREREYIMANTFEAVLGAIYLEFGMGECQKFLDKELFYKVDDIVKNEKYKDPKSTLQEVTQNKYSITPSYKILAEEGPDHNKKFTAGVFLKDKILAVGEGSNKQSAQEDAAKKALVGLNGK